METSNLVRENSHRSPDKADIIVADKSIDTLKTVEIAQQILETKLNNDPNMWMTAMFRAILLRNTEYLWLERNSRSPAQVLAEQLKEEITKAYLSLKAAHEKPKLLEEEAHSDFIFTSSSLIKVFQKFTNLLVNENDFKIDLSKSQVYESLKKIERNLSKYLAMEDKSEPFKVPQSNKENARADPVCAETSAAPTVAHTSIVTSDGATIDATPKRVKLETHRKCGICDQLYTIFNNDEVLSRDLHEQEKVHKNAIKKNTRITTSAPSTSSKEVRRLSEGDKSNKISDPKNVKEAKKMLYANLGSQSSNIDFVSPKEYYCKTCQCPISGFTIVLAHVQGKKHQGLVSRLNKSKVQAKLSSAVPKKGQKSNTDARNNAAVPVSCRKIPVQKLML